MSLCKKRCFDGLRWAIVVSVMAWNAVGIAQQTANRSEPPTSMSADSVNDSVRELREQVRELQAAVVEMRSDWQRSREETAQLRRELEQFRAGTAPQNAMLKDAATQNAASNLTAERDLQNDPPQDQEEKKRAHSASLEEEYQLLSGKIDDQYQTKVESASKYRVRLSGIVLTNFFSNQGVVDSIDLPTLSYPRPPGDSGGSFGATLRQSQIGFEAFGPTVAGARTRADLQLDLAGGFPSVPDGTAFGYMRLRTATMRMDWTNTSVVVGQDTLFFSPNSPTSFATLAIPALTYAGNLWSWVPQIRVEHKVTLSDNSSLLFQGGILDPLSGEVPGTTPGSDYYRAAGPGEMSRQPAYATRIAFTQNVFGQPLHIGAGGYYSRQDYGFNRDVDGWAGMADLELPLSHQFSLSGKFYRGRAVGGLYGAFGESVLFDGDPTQASTQVQALDSVGGWGQLKFRPLAKWEFNAAFGMDNAYASDLRYFPYVVSYGDPTLARNQTGFVNMIYRPRSDLLFSAEYRHLTTFTTTGSSSSAGHLNLMMGVLF